MKPQAGEFASFYQGYIDRVPAGNIVQTLVNNRQQTLDFLKSIPGDKWNHRYADGKWSIRELLIHIMDAERIFAYRALRIARNDQTSLAGFDENAYVPESFAAGRSVESLLEEYAAVRAASVQLYKNLHPDVWTRLGDANGNPVSVRALAYITAGHEMHHMSIIKERYL